ncbi:hypothetical protein [Aquimarina algicola]|uniref:Uncharacterized protein n=1 Tax=Aquimarina algicola TaxID=2589995 RepID=A0A504JI43_9FLAO|nr:hypothetical protein [Aquimarina algicola]TPN86141.1 hypothetical protein FHK87_12775 [Aquimarina algicola]
MLPNLKVTQLKQISREQQKFINGGRIPTLKEFCCGPRSQGWWIQQYPFLATDPYYTCTIDVCSN